VKGIIMKTMNESNRGNVLRISAILFLFFPKFGGFSS